MTAGQKIYINDHEIALQYIQAICSKEKANGISGGLRNELPSPGSDERCRDTIPEQFDISTPPAAHIDTGNLPDHGNLQYAIFPTDPKGPEAIHAASCTVSEKVMKAACHTGALSIKVMRLLIVTWVTLIGLLILACRNVAHPGLGKVSRRRRAIHFFGTCMFRIMQWTSRVLIVIIGISFRIVRLSVHGHKRNKLNDSGDEKTLGRPSVAELTKTIAESDEVVVPIEGPRKQNFKPGLRAKGQSSADGSVGLLTVRDKNGTAFAEADNKYFQCTSSVAMTDNDDIKDCKVMRAVGVKTPELTQSSVLPIPPECHAICVCCSTPYLKFEVGSSICDDCYNEQVGFSSGSEETQVF